MTIGEIQSLYKNELIILNRHFLDRIGMRGILLNDIKTAIENGVIIEQYPDDYPYPSALILGYSNDSPLHVLVGIGGGYVWLITSYYPDFIKWEADNKTRKAVE